LELRIARHRAGAAELVGLTHGAVVRARLGSLEAAELARLLSRVAQPIRRALTGAGRVFVALDDTRDLTDRAVALCVVGGNAGKAQLRGAALGDGVPSRAPGLAHLERRADAPGLRKRSAAQGNAATVRSDETR